MSTDRGKIYLFVSCLVVITVFLVISTQQQNWSSTNIQVLLSSDDDDDDDQSTSSLNTDRVIFYMKTSWVGGLNNNRQVILQSLALAKNWNIRYVVLPGACLKLRNIGQDVIEAKKSGHKYLPPFDYVNLSRIYLRNRNVWRTEYCNENEAFGHLFDQKIFINSLRKSFGIEVVLPNTSTFSTASSSSSSLPLEVARRISRDEFDHEITIPNNNSIPWETLANNQKLVLEPSKFLPSSSSTSSLLQPVVVVKVKDEFPHRSVYDFQTCAQLPFCMELAQKSLTLPKLLLHKFVQPIRRAILAKELELGLKPNSYIAVHFRSFNCGDGIKNFARLHLFLEDKLRRNETTINNKTILYMSTDVAFEKYQFLEQYGYVLMTKTTIDPTFNVVDYPFEVMAHVDQVVCAEAGTFVSSSGVDSSFFRFVNFEREWRGRSSGLSSEEDCFKREKERKKKRRGGR